jgi:hypothetical protein
MTRALNRPSAVLRSPATLLLAVTAFSFWPAPARAQDEVPPPIGRFAVDLHGTFPKFTNTGQLAASRGLAQNELPGIGLGLYAGAHVYVFRWKAMTIGLGGDLTLARSHSSAKELNGAEIARAVTERFTHASPQLSLNFGDGDGWSYLSGGIGPARWSVVPDNGVATPADEERLQTISYGGGARWFVRRHLAFSFDVRFYAISPGTPQGDRPGSPRTTLFVAGGGISIK